MIEGINKSFRTLTITIVKIIKVIELTNMELNLNQLLKINKQVIPIR